MLLLLIAAFGMGLMQRSAQRAYLGAAADAAALNAAAILTRSEGCDPSALPATECDSVSRWKQAPTLALSAIKASLPPPGLFTDTASGLTSLTCPSDPSPDAPIVCSTTNQELQMKFEHGAWRKNQETGVFGFEPLDVALSDYAALRPGIPRLVAFNAVRVTVAARPIRLPLPLIERISARALPSTKVSIATVVHDQTTQTAPFAIPLCSLLRKSSGPNNSGNLIHNLETSSNYSAKEICYADRLIAPTSRYCPASEDGQNGHTNCRGVVPQFNWDPDFFSRDNELNSGYARLANNDYWKPTDWNGSTQPTGNNGQGPSQPSATGDYFCFWGSPRYQEPEDNFGFVVDAVAEDGTCTTPAESSFFGSTVNAQGTPIPFVQPSMLRVGEKVCAVQNGFTSAQAKEAVWRTISRTFDTVAAGSPQTTNYAINSAQAQLVRQSQPELLMNNNLAFTDSDAVLVPVSPTDPDRRCILPQNIPTTTAAWGSSDTVQDAVRRPRWPRAWTRFGIESTNDTGMVDPNIPELEQGTCNSMRTGWGHWGDGNPPDPSNRAGLFYRPSAGNVQPWYKNYTPLGFTPNSTTNQFSGHFTTVPMWSTWVAIVADGRSAADGGQPCAGTIPNSASDGVAPAYDPRIDPSVPLEVVGFLKLQVYDLDISDPPPTFIQNVAPFTSTQNFKFITRRSGPNTAADQGAAYRPATPLPSYYQWSFIRPDQSPAWDRNSTTHTTPPQSCNLVRARLACTQPSIPAAGGVDGELPLRLVVDAASVALER